jgi:type III pantothenate kinase
MLLALDIGNTNIAIGVFLESKLKEHWRIKTEAERTCDEYIVVLRGLLQPSPEVWEQITGVIISSVVPPLTPVFQKLSRDMFGVKPLTVGPGLKTGMPIKYENPQEVGADRVVSAVAALELYGGPCIVVDFGTATTFDAVSAQGEYLGGAIAPGVQISADALFAKTAKLPSIEIRRPEMAIGRTTVASMQSGLYYGYVGLVSVLIERIQAELGGNAKVVATGGFAPVIRSEIDAIDYEEPHLVLQGLCFLYHRHKKN